MAHILCFNCRTNTVPAPTFTFTDTSVTVGACGDCRTAHGLVSAVVRKSTLLGELDVPTYTVRHSEGLVAFA